MNTKKNWSLGSRRQQRPEEAQKKNGPTVAPDCAGVSCKFMSISTTSTFQWGFGSE